MLVHYHAHYAPWLCGNYHSLLSILQGDDDGYGEASYSPTGSTTQHNQQSLVGVASTICPDLTHSADRLTPEESVNEDEVNVDERKDSADRDEGVQPITASTEERGELVIGHRVGCIAKIIDDGELVIGVSLGYIPKVIDDGELAIGALCI